MIRRALLAIVALTAPARAGVVFTNTDEVRACLPLAGGDTLVGTAGGLVRVDPAGLARRVWTASDGLPGTRIDALVADGARVWIGTDAGIAEFTGDVSRAVSTRPVRDIARWHGTTYLATWDGGVIAVGDGHGAAVASGDGHGSAAVAVGDGHGAGHIGAAVAMRGGAPALRMRASALALAGDTLWAGTAAGLYQMRNGKFERVDGPRDVTALVADGTTLWIGASDGLWTRDGHGVRALGGGEVRHLAIVDGAIDLTGDDPGSAPRARRSAVDPTGEDARAADKPVGVPTAGARRSAIVAAGADGLTTVDRGRVVPLAGAPRGFAQAIGAAHGAACTGGLDGLWTRMHGAWHHAPKAGGPPSSDISAVVADGARLWVGTFDQGLASYDPDRGWQRIAGAGSPDLRINALVLEPRSDGARLWVATAQGIQVLDAAGNTVRRLGRSDGLPSRSVLSIARLADGRIVAGTSVGAAFVGDGGVQRVGPRGLGDRGIGNVWAIAETSAGLWLGTTTGLYRGPATPWTSKDGSDDDAALADRWQRLSVASGHLRDDWVTALVARGDVVWAGTYNGGVARIDGDTATALGGGWINPSGLRWDGDRLLAATMDGLVAGDGRTATWTATRGLPGRDVTAAVRTGKTLWVATRRGLIALD